MWTIVFVCVWLVRIWFCYWPWSTESICSLSRLTKTAPGEQYQYDDEYIRTLATRAVPKALKIREVEQASAEDSKLQVASKDLIEGKWDTGPSQYLHVRNELNCIGYVILRGRRIVPWTLRRRVVYLSPEWHQGVMKTTMRCWEQTSGDQKLIAVLKGDVLYVMSII